MKIYDNRAESEIVGHAILLGITILGISVITLYGVPAILSLQDLSNVKNTEQAFTVLDSHASKAALGQAPVQITDINLGGGTLTVVPNSSSEPSYMLVELINESNVVVYNATVPMGKIIYSLEDREVGYEDGGVWSKYPSGSVMLSPPEFHYNGITLTLPVMNISGKSSIGGKGAASVSIEKTGTPLRIYPDAAYNNPIPENITMVNVTIKSEYYDAWESFFKGAPLMEVYRDDLNKTVTVTLDTPPLVPNLLYAVLASDWIYMGNSAEIQSYNSSNGSHLVSSSGNGSIRAKSQITLRNSGVVNGSALSGGSINCDHGNSCGTVKKDAWGSPIDTDITVGGQRHEAVGDIHIADTTSLVQGKIDQFKAGNNNGGPPCFSGASNTELNPSASWAPSGTCTISAGKYYLTKFDMEDNTNKNLVFDTSVGDVNIAVDMPAGDIIWKKADINVTGPYAVKIYLKGGLVADSGHDNVWINRYNNPNDTSSRFQIYSSSSRTISFQQGGTQFCGFVYAPYAEIDVQQSAQIFGALVGKQFTISQSQMVYYDEALRDLYTGLSSGVTIMYLHVTRNDIGAGIS